MKSAHKPTLASTSNWIELFVALKRSSYIRVKKEDAMLNQRFIRGCMETMYSSIWEPFALQIPTEQAARDFVVGFLKEHVLCPKCDTPVEERNSDNKVQCTKCKHTWYVTKNTIFENMKLYRPLLAAIRFVEEGVNIPATRLAALCGTAYATAWECLKKAFIAFQCFHKQEGTEVPSAAFIGVFAKRSFVTPAQEHPNSEEDIATQHLVPPNAYSNEEDLSEDEKAVLIAAGPSKIKLDTLIASLNQPMCDVIPTIISLETRAYIKSLPGGIVQRIKRPKPGEGPELDEVQSHMVGSVMFHILQTSRRISRKYLQLYLGVIRGRFGSPVRTNSFLQFCLRYEPITLSEIKEFVSEPTVVLKVSSYA